MVLADPINAFSRPEEICKIRGDRPWTVTFTGRILRGMVLPDRDLVILGDNFRKLRKGRGWTQEEMAARAGVDERHYQDFEAARRISA